MQPFSEVPVKPDVSDAAKPPETNVDRPNETEGWKNSIELPDDTGGWQNHLELPGDSGEWQDKIDLINTCKKNVNTPSVTSASFENTDTNTDGSETQTYPCEKTVDGEKYYYDSQGNLYRVGNQLLPNNSYEINGYTYKTDELKRIVSAEGKLRLKDDRDKLRIKDSMEAVGKGDQKDSDDRGHLIGDQFDGSNGLENLVPQDSNVNRGDFKNFENELAKEVRSGNDVSVKVEPIYEGDSRRPSVIVVTYTINGSTYQRFFNNN